MTIEYKLANVLTSIEPGTLEPNIVTPFRAETSKQNQFIFFFKPEVFLVKEPAKRQGIFDLAFATFAEFGAEIAGAAVLPGAYLEAASSMDRHYGYINTMSREASTALVDDDAEAVQKAVGAAPILGGHEYLRKAGIDARTLDALWQEKRSTKIRSGLYVSPMELEGRPVVVVNGFHPYQLAHFTANDRMIAVLLIESDLPWSVLRARMIGDTFPEKAVTGSIRRKMRDAAVDLGLGTVGITNNCVHLSAGPFEAFFEMMNFLGSLPNAGFDLQATVVAKRLAKLGLAHHAEKALANPHSTHGSLFDVTEGIDAYSAVHLYSNLFSKA